jgi:hypothetical protein
MTIEKNQIAYYYNGVVKPEETDLDRDGLSRIPSEGEILVRPGGKQWKVAQVIARHRGSECADHLFGVLDRADLRVGGAGGS